MSSTQNWSRCRRQTSRSIWRHSARGSNVRRTRSRSSQPLLREGFVAAGFVAGRFRIAAGSDHAQALAGAHQQGRGVGGEHELVGLLEQGLGLAAREVEAFERARAVLVAAAAVRAGNRQPRPQHMTFGGAGDAAEAALGHREGQHAAFQPVEIDARQAARRHAARRLVGLRILHAARRRFEGRGCIGLQRHQIGPRARAENSARTAGCRRPGRRCGWTGNRDAGRRARRPATSRETRAA